VDFFPFVASETGIFIYLRIFSSGWWLWFVRARHHNARSTSYLFAFRFSTELFDSMFFDGVRASIQKCLCGFLILVRGEL